MGKASNSLKTSDVTATPIKLKYSSSFASSSFEQYGIQVYAGVNEPITELVNVPNDVLTYRSIRHLYYSNYLTGSFPTTSYRADNWLQSTAYSGSIEADQRYFPTASNETIQVLSIPREVFGEKVAKRSFNFKTDNCFLYDDGNGNIWDLATLTGSLQALYYQNKDEYFSTVQERGTHVGNIIYAQGMVIITNQDYQLIV